MKSYYCKPPKNLSFQGNLSENWRKFKQNFNIFLKASGSEEKKSEVKVALLLNFMGEDGVELYNSFNLDEIDHLFFSKENDWGFRNFIYWRDVLKVEYGYVKDDSITPEVHLVAGVPHGVK